MNKHIRAERLRRSYLFVPLSSEKFIAKAEQLEILDVVILDLEDGVSPDAKEDARAVMSTAAKRLKESGKDVFIRVNNPVNAIGIKDLLAVDLHYIDAVMLPKACEKSIFATDAILNYLENIQEIEQGQTEIAVMIETGEGLLAADKMLLLSDRISTVVFGAEDYSSDICIRKENAPDLIDFARVQLVTLARSFRLDAVDSPCTNFREKEIYEQAIAGAKKLGFTGKTSIHPVMVEEINTAFSPSQEEIEEAQAIWDVYIQGIREQKGAVSYKGKMIDKPVAEKARKLLQKASIAVNE